MAIDVRGNNKVLAKEEERVREFLTPLLGARPTNPLSKDPGEELYFLDVDVPDSKALDLLHKVEPLLRDISWNNDFMICVVPLPPVPDNQA